MGSPYKIIKKKKKLAESNDQLTQNTSQNITSKIKLNEALDTVKRLSLENSRKDDKTKELVELLNAQKEESSRNQQKLESELKTALSSISELSSTLESKDSQSQKYNQSIEQLQQQIQTIMNDKTLMQKDYETQLSQVNDRIKSLEADMAYKLHIFDTTKNSFIAKSRELSSLKKDYAQLKEQVVAKAQELERKSLELQKAHQSIHTLTEEQKSHPREMMSLLSQSNSNMAREKELMLQLQHQEQLHKLELTHMIKTHNIGPGTLICGKKFNNQYRIIQSTEDQPITFKLERNLYPYVIGRIVFIEGNSAHIEINENLTRRFNS